MPFALAKPRYQASPVVFLEDPYLPRPLYFHHPRVALLKLERRCWSIIIKQNQKPNFSGKKERGGCVAFHSIAYFSASSI